ncbi:MAG: hypothetical protein LUH11_00390 [Candidatus Gastranaerophilales bacterium]|nr:hypothetical protein [Candidatus Gastranaerophilales bacterium]
MKPVSFGSLMVFTLNDNKAKLDVPSYMKLAFNNNNDLKKYKLTDTVEFNKEFNEEIDGTVHNAAKNFAEKLDVLYKDKLQKGSQKVILTEADFYVSPRETQKRYFLTAATDADEKKIHNILSKSSMFYTAKFGYKQ